MYRYKKIQEIEIQEDTGDRDTRRYRKYRHNRIQVSRNFGSKRKTHQNILPVSHFTREV
jgi:hypothetical protein